MILKEKCYYQLISTQCIYFINFRCISTTVQIHFDPLSFYFQNQPLISYGRPKGDGEVRMVSSIDKRKQDRLIYLCVLRKKGSVSNLHLSSVGSGLSFVTLIHNFFLTYPIQVCRSPFLLIIQ